MWVSWVSTRLVSVGTVGQYKVGLVPVQVLHHAVPHNAGLVPVQVLHHAVGHNAGLVPVQVLHHAVAHNAGLVPVQVLHHAALRMLFACLACLQTDP